MARDEGEQQAMTRERLRQALDDSVLTHTGRSIGDLASQRVIDDIWPLIQAREAALVAEVERLRAENERLTEKLAAATRVAEALEGLQDFMQAQGVKR